MHCLLFACNSDKDVILETDAENPLNQVLVLKVDYASNAFEGGIVLGFSQKTKSFTVENEYVPPGDFGSVKLIYKELNRPLFEGTIHWMGAGKMTFPERLEPASSFEHVMTYDLCTPTGFENVFNPHNQELDYDKPWLSVQGLVKVRAFLAANPGQKVKLFLYTPGVGVGDSAGWYLVIFLRD